MSVISPDDDPIISLDRTLKVPKQPIMIYVDSRDRLIATNLLNVTDSGVTPTWEFTVMLNQPLSRITQIDLVNFSMPNTIYNINAPAFTGDGSANNSMVFTVGGTTYTITIPSGAYSAANFLSAVQTAMNNAAPGNNFVITTSATTYKVTITNNNPFVLNLTNTGFTMGIALGFLPFSDTPLSTSATSNYAINMSIPSMLFIYIKEANTRSWTTTQGAPTSPSFFIPINSNTPNDIFFYEGSQWKYSLTQLNIAATSLTFQLLVPYKSHTGATITYGVAPASSSGMDWSALLRLHQG